MSHLVRRLSLFVVVAASTASLRAQTPVTAPRAGAVALPSPADFAGAELGARPWFSDDFVRYAERLDALSERVLVRRYGTSVGGRPLFAALVSLPQHLARLAEISAASPTFGSPASRPVAADDDPVLLWFGAGIHGDELSGGEALAALLHRLAVDDSPAGEARLRGTVIALDLVQNPDGRDRFVTHVRDATFGAGDATPLAFEHRPPWPGGRVNGHLFDLNRDWYLQTQPESRARGAFLREFRPQIVLDLHEMDGENSYFFAAPPADPQSPFVAVGVRETAAGAGDAIRRAFDAAGRTYFAGELFPADFPGYGGAYPNFLGAAALTLEQASARGLRRARVDGTITTLAEGAGAHFDACLAVADYAAADRRGVRARALAAREGEDRAEDEAAVYWLDRRASGAVRRLGRTLVGAGVAVEELTKPWTGDVAPLGGGPTERRTFAAGSLLVRTAQGARPLVRALLAADVGPEPAFAAAEEERLRRRVPGEIYDATAWNLPWTFGAAAFVGADAPRDAALRPFDPLPRASGIVVDPRRPLVFRGDADGALPLAAKLAASGVRVRTAPFAFDAGGRSFGPGAFVVLPEANPGEAARRAWVDVVRAAPLSAEDLAAPAGTSTERGLDLGSPRLRPVTASRVVLAFGAPCEPASAGALRYFLREGLGLAPVVVAVEDLGVRVLAEADVLVLPDGAADAYAKRLGADVLAAFLGRGGVAVGIKGAAAYLARVGFAPREERGVDDPFGDYRGPLVRAIAEDHWLTPGGGEFAVFLRRRGLAATTGEGWRVAVRTASADRLRRQGFLPPESAVLAADLPVIAARRTHGGLVVTFAEDPTFRGATPALEAPLARAILCGPAEAR